MTNTTRIWLAAVALIATGCNNEPDNIAESWAVRDDLGTLIQMGHLPRPGSPELATCLTACRPR